MEIIEYPAFATKYFQALKSKYEKELTFAIFYFHSNEPLTKKQLRDDGEKLGKSAQPYYNWLDSTMPSPHGGMKGVVVPAGKIGKERTFKLSELGLEQAKALVLKMKDEAT